MPHANRRTNQDILHFAANQHPTKRTNQSTNKRSTQPQTSRPCLKKTGVPYLFSRVDSHGRCTFQYRRRLQSSSIQRSLLTDDLSTAILLTQELNRATQIVQDAVQETMAKTTDKSSAQHTSKKSQPHDLPFHTIKKALNKAYDKALARYKIRMDKDGPYSPEAVQKLQKTFDEDAEWNEVLSILPGHKDDPTPAEEMAKLAGLTDPTENDLNLIASLRPSMLQYLLRAVKEYNSSLLEFEGEIPKSSDVEHTQFTAKQTSIQDLIDAFIVEKKLGEAWSDKSAAEIASILNSMREILLCLEVQYPSDISFEIARSFKEVLTVLPANPTERKAYLKDLKENGGVQTKIVQKIKCISVTTVNKYLIRINALMDYAFKHGYIVRNFFDGLGIKQKKRKGETRKEFQPEQVQDIIKATLERSSLKEAKTKPFHRWLPLLGIYTGARLNELCQIYLDDIIEKDGIACLSITDKRTDQRLKNLSSERVIPIHPELISLGFLEFVQELRDKGESRLFPELRHGRDGHSKNASRWFGAFRKEILPEADGLVFHSFRHTVATEMKRKGVEEGLAASILGHSNESMTYGHYGKEYTARQLLDALTVGLKDLVLN